VLCVTTILGRVGRLVYDIINRRLNHRAKDVADKERVDLFLSIHLRSLVLRVSRCIHHRRMRVTSSSALATPKSHPATKHNVPDIV
jgi:hypothetical protein